MLYPTMNTTTHLPVKVYAVSNNESYKPISLSKFMLCPTMNPTTHLPVKVYAVSNNESYNPSPCQSLCCIQQ